MQRRTDSFERLRLAVGELAREDVERVLSEAREAARERVREILTDVLAESMLEQVQSPRSGQAPSGAAEAPRERQSAEPTPTEELRVSETAREPPSNAASDELALYVYGVVRRGQGAQLAQCEGVDPAYATSIVAEDELAAIVSPVALADFDEDRLRAHFEDMHWVEQIARAHEDVLEQAGRSATVVPMRMCTVYRDESGLRQMLTRERENLLLALTELEGKSEWGVKTYLEPQPAPATPDAGSGAEYMQARMRQREDAARVASTVEDACNRIHERLSAAASAGLLLTPHRRDAGGDRAEMVLNAAYLVADDALPEFHRVVRSLDSEFGELGVSLEETGPWPAYNFVPGAIGAAL
jgi:hypothetical protein